MWPTSIAGVNESAAAAHGAGVAHLRLADVREPGLVVTAGLHAAEMPTVHVRARDELALAKRLVSDHLDRRRQPGRASRRRRRRRPWISSSSAGRTSLENRLTSLDFASLSSPRTSAQDERAVRLDHRHRLGRGRRVDPEKLRKPLDRGDAGGVDLRGRVEPFGKLRRARDGTGDVDVGRVVAVLTLDKRVLARRSRREEVRALAAAHHSGLRLDGVHLEPAPLEDPVVGDPVLLEALVQAGLVPVERSTSPS